MKVKLILPRLQSREGTLSDFNYLSRLLTPNTAYGRPNVMAFMPLALPTLAALTPPDIEVSIADENIAPIDFDAPVDLVGITFVSFMAPQAYRIAEAFRARGVHTVLGGVHATLRPDEALQHADTVVVGEAETTWPQLLADFRRGAVQRIYRAEAKPDLQRAVVPRWDLVDHRYYLNQLVQTTRGCSSDCDFCTIRSLYGPPRSKPVENVLAELEEIRKYKRMPGPLRVMFADDNIIGNTGYAKRLFQAIRPLGIRWSSQASLNIAADTELLDLAQASGCDTLLIGFESISQQSLDSVNKGRTNRAASFKEAVERIHARGINVYAYLIFGFDDDDPDVFQRTVDFVQETSIEFPLFNMLTPAVGTRLHERFEKEGRLLPARWEQLNGYSVCFRPARMTPHQLEEGFRGSIVDAYSFEALFQRLAQSYACGALRSPDKAWLSRFATTLILAKELLLGDPAMRKAIARVMLELWRKPGVKVHALLMALDRFQFARQLAARRKSAPAAL